MLKKTIEYTDYNGVERKEDFFFHLSQAEIVEMEMSVEGGMSEYINRISNTQEIPALIEIFKDIILKSYGEKSADGKKFMKIDDQGKPLSVGFSQTEAYSNLFMELATNPEAAADFVNGIIPK